MVARDVQKLSLKWYKFLLKYMFAKARKRKTKTAYIGKAKSQGVQL